MTDHQELTEMLLHTHTSTMWSPHTSYYQTCTTWLHFDFLQTWLHFDFLQAWLHFDFI